MKINITEKIQNETSEIFVTFARKELIVSKDSQTWNTESINKFLIEIVSEIPEEEKLEIQFDDSNENPIYIHIVDLFNNFAEELNSLL
ncbi:MAG: hypothetical protein ACRC4L_03355 [Mycoplasma sp.]